MDTTELTPYEAIQVEQIAAWKGRKPGVLSRTIETLKSPLGWLFEKAMPAGEARKLFARMNQAANWEVSHDVIESALGIDQIEDLRDGPLERCDGLVRKVEDLTREVVTSESLLANVGGLATELLEIPEEVLLALRSVHRVAACYGYKLDGPRDQALILAIIGLSLVDEPEDRLKAWAQIRFLEDGGLSQEDQERLVGSLGRKLKDEVYDDLVSDIVATLVEEKAGEGIPILGAAVGVVLDNAFIEGVEETARRTFQERWLAREGEGGRDPAGRAERPDRRVHQCGPDAGGVFDQLRRRASASSFPSPWWRRPGRRSYRHSARRHRRRGSDRKTRRRPPDRGTPRRPDPAGSTVAR